MMTLEQWAEKWNIPQAAMRDLVVSLDTELGDMVGRSEAAVQTEVRKKASRAGWRLWRNNVGAYTNEYGRHVRYGLCNESKQMSANFKSSDLIGIKPRVIQPEDVGTTIGQFAAVEVKKGSWMPGESKREEAQSAFLALVKSLGGVAGFSTGELP